MLNHTGLPLFFKQVPPDSKENAGEIKVIRKYAQLESLDPKDWYGEGGELFGEVPSHRDTILVSGFSCFSLHNYIRSAHTHTPRTHAERTFQAAGSAYNVRVSQARYRWQQGFGEDC